MNTNPEICYSVCPHDCPSTCALEVEKIDERTIGRVRGAKENSYTAGVICSKVARYADRIHHPDRLTQPLRRIGAKGSGAFEPISWDDALALVAEGFLKAETKLGSETVWPYIYAGTMGLLMRGGAERMRHAKKYSGQHDTICAIVASTGFVAGTGRAAGPDPREMAKSDLVIIWGTNPANTQVNVLTHALAARRQRGAKIVCVDVYETGTAKQADEFLCLRPGTDGALACAVMHVLFRDGYADWDYLERYTDCPKQLEQHLQSKTPQWAAAITGLSTDEIEAFARLIGTTPRSYFRLGYGFTRQRNGAVNMHAASCIPAVTGAWLHEGGGAFHINSHIYHWDRTLIKGLDVLDPMIRSLDQSRIGAILCGNESDLKGGPPVTALFIQNHNPMMVAPDLTQVHRGFARDDLFVCVHEQFMTDTAKMADVVLPATMFLEHNDIYQGGGHQYILSGPKVIEPPEQCRSNHQVICDLAKRLGVEHEGFGLSEREMIDRTLRASNWGSLEQLEKSRWIDCQPPFEQAHYLDGFDHPDQKFHFSPNWSGFKPTGFVSEEKLDDMPELPDHWQSIEEANNEYPFRLVTAPARGFLNSTFTETPTSQSREKRPAVMIHPFDAKALKIGEGDRVRLGSSRGSLVIHALLFDGTNRGVVVVESIWPNDAFEEGIGINVLTGADACAPVGGAMFHDNRVWIRRP